MVKEWFLIRYYNPDGTEIPGVSVHYYTTYERTVAAIERKYLTDYYAGCYAQIDKIWLDGNAGPNGPVD